MKFKKFIELKLPHVNDVGFKFADKLSLIRGKTTAMNQSETNCYAVASELAKNFGFEPAPADEIRRIRDNLKRYWYEKRYNPNIKPPIMPKPGLANFIVRDGDELMSHVSFEYRGKEYNYGAASDQGFEILFRIPLKTTNTVKENLLNFYTLQEQIATKSYIGNNNIINNNNEDGGDDDENDKSWEWDQLKRFDNDLINWTANDPFAKRIKNAIIELVFKNEPEIDVKEYFGDDENEFDFSPTGTIVLGVEWKMPVDSIEDSLLATLRKSTIWRALKIQPNELWGTLDKGDLFEYIYYHIRMSVIGHNPSLYDQHYHAERPEWQRLDNDYFKKSSDWQKDKQTLEKYAKFMIYQKDEQLKQYVKNYLPFEVNVTKTRENVRALVWEENFDASANIWYQYEKID